MNALVKLVGGRIEIHLGETSIALAGTHENAKLAQEIAIAVNEHAALVAVAEFMAETKEAFLDAVDRGESDASIVEIMRGFLAGDVISDALANLAAVREGCNPHTGETNDEKESRIAAAFGIKREGGAK